MTLFLVANDELPPPLIYHFTMYFITDFYVLFLFKVSGLGQSGVFWEGGHRSRDVSAKQLECRLKTALK